MNTTKTELLEEFLIPEKFVTEHLRGDQEPLFELHGDVQELHHLLKQHFSKALDRYRDSVVEEEREKINKYGRKYNKYPSRMLRSKHKYHKRINKKFNNCNLCREEI